MKNPNNVKWLAAGAFAASTAMLTLAAAPATAAVPERTKLTDFCQIIPANNNLFCVTGTVHSSQTVARSGNIMTRYTLKLLYEYWDGPAKVGEPFIEDVVTQTFTLEKNGQLAVRTVRGVLEFVGLPCIFRYQAAIAGGEFRIELSKGVCKF